MLSHRILHYRVKIEKLFLVTNFGNICFWISRKGKTMAMLAELGLKEVIRNLPNDFSAALYLLNGPIVAWVIRRKLPVSRNHIVNARISWLEEGPLVPEQLIAITDWFSKNLTETSV